MSSATIGLPVIVVTQIATRDDEVPNGVQWDRWVAAALDHAAKTSPGGTLTVRLVGLDESRQLNSTYREKSGATNVLAFPGPDENMELSPMDRQFGDLVICLPIVYTEANEQGKQPLAHLAHLVVHGTLHLLGFDHDVDVAAKRMEELETSIMLGLGFPDPYPIA
jgi:probable rRNA maturation factor